MPSFSATSNARRLTSSVDRPYAFSWTRCGRGFQLQVEEEELVDGALTSQYLAWVQPCPDVFGVFELEYGSVCWLPEEPCLLQQHPKLGPADQTHNHFYLHRCMSSSYSYVLRLKDRDGTYTTGLTKNMDWRNWSSTELPLSLHRLHLDDSGLLLDTRLQTKTTI